MQPFGTKGMLRGPRDPDNPGKPLERLPRYETNTVISIYEDHSGDPKYADTAYEPKGRLPILPSTPYAKGGIWSLTDPVTNLKWYPGLRYPTNHDTGAKGRLYSGHINQIASGDVKWYLDEDGKPCLIFSDATQRIHCMTVAGITKWTIHVPTYMPAPPEGCIRSYRIDPKRSVISNNEFVLLISYCDWAIKPGQKPLTFVYYVPEYDCPGEKWHWTKKELSFDISDSFKIHTYKHCLLFVDLAKEKIEGGQKIEYSPPSGISGYSGYSGDVPAGLSGYSGTGKYAGDYARVVKILDVFTEALCGPLAFEVQAPTYGGELFWEYHPWLWKYNAFSIFWPFRYPFNQGGTCGPWHQDPVPPDDPRAWDILTPQQYPEYCPGPPGGQAGPPCIHGVWWPHPIFVPGVTSSYPGAGLNCYKSIITEYPHHDNEYGPTIKTAKVKVQEFITPSIEGIQFRLSGTSWQYLYESGHLVPAAYGWTAEETIGWDWGYNPTEDYYDWKTGGTMEKWKFIPITRPKRINTPIFRREKVFEDCLSTDSTFSDITLYTKNGGMAPAKPPGSTVSDPASERKAVFLRWGPATNDAKEIWPIGSPLLWKHCLDYTGGVESIRDEYIDYTDLDPEIFATLPMPPPDMPDVLAPEKQNMDGRFMMNNHPCLHRDAKAKNKINLCIYNLDKRELEINSIINIPEEALEPVTGQYYGQPYPQELVRHLEWPIRPWELQSTDTSFTVAGLDVQDGSKNIWNSSKTGKYKFSLQSGDTYVGEKYFRPLMGYSGYTYNSYHATGEGYTRNGRNQQVIIPLKAGSNEVGKWFFISCLGRVDTDMQLLDWYKQKPNNESLQSDVIQSNGLDLSRTLGGWAVVDQAGTIRHSQNNLSNPGAKFASDTYVRWACYCPLDSEELIVYGEQKIIWYEPSEENGYEGFYDYKYAIKALNVLTGGIRTIESGNAILHSAGMVVRIVGGDGAISDAIVVWSRQTYTPGENWGIPVSTPQSTLTKSKYIYSPTIRPTIENKVYDQFIFDGQMLYATNTEIMDVISIDSFTVKKTGASPYNQTTSGGMNLLVRRKDWMKDGLTATTKLQMYKYDPLIPDGYSGTSGYGYSGYSG